MSAGDPVGRRAFVVGAGAAMLAGGAVSPAVAGVVDGPLPDFHPALKAELDFPLAWGTSPVRDFRAWRRTARATVEEHLLVDREDGTSYAPAFASRSQGDGYTRELVTLSLTRHERVRAQDDIAAPGQLVADEPAAEVLVRPGLRGGEPGVVVPGPDQLLLPDVELRPVVVQEQHGREGAGAVRGEEGGPDTFVVGEGERHQLAGVAALLVAVGELGGVRGAFLPSDDQQFLDLGAGSPAPGAEVA